MSKIRRRSPSILRGPLPLFTYDGLIKTGALRVPRGRERITL
jgi:hypothetical protein